MRWEGSLLSELRSSGTAPLLLLQSPGLVENS